MIEEKPLNDIFTPKQKSVKIKIEFSDDSGTKYSFNIEGTSKENISKLIDFAQTVSSTEANNPENEPVDTNFARIYDLIRVNFKFGSFTSKDIKEAYEHDFRIPISLSVVSTYLSRLAHRNLLLRSRNGSGWIYKLTKIEETKPNQQMNMLAHGEIPP